MHGPEDGEAVVTIDDGGVLARWADWRARGMQTPGIGDRAAERADDGVRRR